MTMSPEVVKHSVA